MAAEWTSLSWQGQMFSGGEIVGEATLDALIYTQDAVLSVGRE